MRKQKMLSVVILFALLATTLAGCGQSGNTSQDSGSGQPQTAESTAGTAEEKTLEQSDAVAGLPDDYPSRTISWIVAADAGAAIDIPTRVLVDNLDLGASVMIENIAGASNVTGTLEAATRAGDGYTILTTNSSGMVTQPSMIDTGYTPEDFRHIALLEPVSPFAVVVGPDSAITSVEEWIAFVQESDKFFYSVPNAGSSAHLAIITALDELGSTTGTFVPYTGSAEVLAGIQNGSLDFGVLGVSDNIIPQQETGNLKILTILNNEICPMAPDVPLISDYGVEGCDCFYGFKYIAVNSETPDEIVNWLKEKIDEALASDGYTDYIESYGLVSLDIVSEEELTTIIENAYDTYSVMLEALGMTD